MRANTSKRRTTSGGKTPGEIVDDSTGEEATADDATRDDSNGDAGWDLAATDVVWVMTRRLTI